MMWAEIPFLTKLMWGAGLVLSVFVVVHAGALLISRSGNRIPVKDTRSRRSPPVEVVFLAFLAVANIFTGSHGAVASYIAAIFVIMYMERKR